MAKDPRTQGYAAALFQVARAEGVLDDVEDELFRFARTLETETRLRDALVDPSLPPDHRAQMIRELLGQRASEHTVNLITFVVQAGRARDLGSIVDSLVELAAQQRNKSLAEVRTAIPLDDAQRDKLKRALEATTGRELELKVIVDRSVVGGLVARVGDMIYDASVKRRLQLAKEQLGRS